MQVMLFLLHVAPQPLDEHIFDSTPLAVHAHAHALGQQRLGGVLRGELCALIGVEDIAGTIARKHFLEGLHTKIRAHGIAHPETGQFSVGGNTLC